MSYNIDRIFSYMTGGPDNDRLGFFLLYIGFNGIYCLYLDV